MKLYRNIFRLATVKLWKKWTFLCAKLTFFLFLTSEIPDFTIYQNLFSFMNIFKELPACSVR